MATDQASLRSPVQFLPTDTASLARGVPKAPVGTLFVLGDRGGVRVAPKTRFQVIFGRNEPEVHVCVGAEDPGVSRQHGMLTWDGDGWNLRNTGAVPIRFPGSRLLLSGYEEPVAAAYTPLFIRTQLAREHLLEVRIAGPEPVVTRARHDDSTHAPHHWGLSEQERLVLCVVGERYLRHEAHPQPASWANAAAALQELQPDQGWTSKRAEHTVSAVRRRMIAAGVNGLTREEIGEPVGNMLNHNLLLELLLSTSLVPPDLRLLG